MSFFRDFLKPKTGETPKPTTPGRPEGTTGDTGLEFSGWYNAATMTLDHASRDDDPRCALVLCSEARIGIDMALGAAKNDRQVALCEALVLAVDKVKEIAKNTPDLDEPHNHGWDRDGCRRVK